MMKHIWKLAWFIFLLLSSLCAQEMMGPPPGSYEFSNTKESVSFPFELEKNHIIITVKVNNGGPVRLVLDTGFPVWGAFLYKTENVINCGMQYAGQAMVGGPGQPMKPADLAENVTFKLPGVNLTKQTVIVTDLDSLQKSKFMDHDGVIGFSIFNYFVVTLDFEKKIITLTEPEKFNYFGPEQGIPLNIEMNEPFITTDITLSNSKKHKIKMIVDLGASHELSLDIQKDKDIIPPSNSVKSFGYGIAGKFDLQIGRINKMMLGEYEFKNVITSFTEKSFTGMPNPIEKGNLGTGLLKRFRVFIDYAGKKMILEPNSSFNSPFEYNMSGIQYSETEDKFLKINFIQPDSPAEKASLKINDIITQIDGEKVNKLTYDKIKEIFKDEGKALELFVIRDKVSFKVKLKLKKII